MVFLDNLIVNPDWQKIPVFMGNVRKEQ